MSDYYHTTFLPQLKIGTQYEIYIEHKVIPKKYPNWYSLTRVKNCPFFDYIVTLQNKEEIKIEIKFDQKFTKTNNFFLEYESFYKKSGISITQADFYIIGNYKLCYIIPVDFLKDIILHSSPPSARIRNCESYNLGYLIRITSVFDEFKYVIDNS